jgi:arylsulfatase
MAPPASAEDAPMTGPCFPFRSQSLRFEFDVGNTALLPRFEVRVPAGTHNVLIVLIDDMGFGQSSAFGGPVHTSTVEALANEGPRFNEFHTTALCSPTRTALFSGRNHYMNNMGGITEIDTAFPS